MVEMNFGDGGYFIFLSFVGLVGATYISRSSEDEYRLTVDRTIGAFIPFVSPIKYR